jgi:hypothetical protein
MSCSLFKRLQPWNKAWSVRPICSSTRFPRSKAASASITCQGPVSPQALSQQAKALSQDLNKVMHRLGRQCRGQGKIFVKLVRDTERHL